MIAVLVDEDEIVPQFPGFRGKLEVRNINGGELPVAPGVEAGGESFCFEYSLDVGGKAGGAGGAFVLACSGGSRGLGVERGGWEGGEAGIAVLWLDQEPGVVGFLVREAKDRRSGNECIAACWWFAVFYFAADIAFQAESTSAWTVATRGVGENGEIIPRLVRSTSGAYSGRFEEDEPVEISWRGEGQDIGLSEPKPTVRGTAGSGEFAVGERGVD